ncbi:hypothetical protein GMLC_02150 [Geomonas limicola]|uniref:SPOR domain-containing protein n=1 Tax=Geomonas limicola TaxID=2740186 RepID=A0A6V8N2C5_9BACT|nr:SPOR domain-containing protein [Geomonas limicola]GFO66636.1 hypothetical protein GMLC_02150 [Geomonas limicola]
MAKDFNPDAEDQLPEKKSSQQLLLLILLLLILVFAYLYFFTGLIKPRGEEPKPLPSPAAEAPVKKPLPPRPDTSKAAPGKPEDAKATAGKPEEKKAEAGKPVAKPEEKKAEAGKPAAKPEEKKAAAGKPEEKKAKPEEKKAAAVPAKEAAKPGAPKEAVKAPAGKPEEKKAAAAKPGQPAKEAKPAQAKEKKTAAKAAGKEAAVPVKKVAAAAYALEINGDLAESEVTSALAKLKKAGIAQVVKTKSQKGEPMHRLFLADFANRDEALEELERLKLAAPDAFMLKENGRYAVYAGSYLRESKAASEQNRLQAKGVQLLPKTATLPVAVYKLRAGAFADMASAEKAAKSLKKSGLDAGVVKASKAK